MIIPCPISEYEPFFRHRILETPGTHEKGPLNTMQAYSNDSSSPFPKRSYDHLFKQTMWKRKINLKEARKDRKRQESWGK